jgi:hypothetical protein
VQKVRCDWVCANVWLCLCVWERVLKLCSVQRFVDAERPVNVLQKRQTTHSKNKGANAVGAADERRERLWKKLRAFW